MLSELDKLETRAEAEKQRIQNLKDKEHDEKSKDPWNNLTEFVVKDSGERQTFSTGAKRDTQSGKGRFDLLPQYALYRLARIFEEGGKKYDFENWRAGIPLRRFLDSGIRHAFKASAGFTDEDHLAQAAWNFLCLIETQYMIDSGLLPKELNDLGKWNGKEWY